MLYMENAEGFGRVWGRSDKYYRYLHIYNNVVCYTFSLNLDQKSSFTAVFKVV